MQIKKYQMESISRLLFSKSIKLSPTDSRLRTRFMRQLEKHYDDYIAELNDLLAYYKHQKEDGTFYVPDAHQEVLNNEITNLGKEYVELSVDLMNEQMLRAVYRILTKDEMEVPSEDSIVHDEVCTELERVFEELNNKEIE